MGAFTNAEQLRLLLQSLLLGVGIGLFYDVLRALRRHFACGRAATAVYDALFWLATAAAFFEFGIVFAAGQDRWFVIGGAVGGMVLYFMSLSGAVLAGAGRTARPCRARLEHRCGGRAVGPPRRRAQRVAG